MVWECRHDTDELARQVGCALEERGFRADGSRSQRVQLLVDEVGLEGGVVDRLREEGRTACGFNGRRAVKSDRYFDRRAESYWRLRNALERGELDAIWSDELVEELLARRWRANPAGQVQLEAKRDAASRLDRSTDRADALAMVYYPWRRVGRSSSGDGPTRIGVVSV